jgi:hypothetical protein
MGLTTGLHPDFGTGLERRALTAFLTSSSLVIKHRYRSTSPAFGSQSDPGPYPVPPNAPIEGGSSSTGDRHVLVIDRDNWKLYEMYRAFPINNGASWNA